MENNEAANGETTMIQKIRNKINCIGIGNVTTLWDLLIYRVSANAFAVGHLTVKIDGPFFDLDNAAGEIERLMD